jgi:hypothetical protein
MLSLLSFGRADLATELFANLINDRFAGGCDRVDEVDPHEKSRGAAVKTLCSRWFREQTAPFYSRVLMVAKVRKNALLPRYCSPFAHSR